MLLAQDTESEYYKLKKKSKKSNIVHVSVNLGLGFNFLNNLRSHEVGTIVFTNPAQTFPKDEYYYENKSLPMASLGINADIIETNKLYLGFKGMANYFYGPDKLGKDVIESSGNYLYGKGKTTGYDLEVLGKIGVGGPAVKIYFGVGTGLLNLEGRIPVKSILPAGSNRTATTTTNNSIDYNWRFHKAVIGFRIGNNRKNVLDVSFYKLQPSNAFFLTTTPPSILETLSSFGKYNDVYPPLPFGISASYVRTGKFNIGFEYRLFRDIDVVEKNANAIQVIFSKHFDFHSRKKK